MKRAHKLLSDGILSRFFRDVTQNSYSIHYCCPKTAHSTARTVPCHSPLLILSTSIPTLAQRSLQDAAKIFFGFFPNDVLEQRFWVKCLLMVARGRGRAQFISRNYMINPSFDSHRRWRSWLPGTSTDATVLGLILANVSVFMLWRVANPYFMSRNFIVSLDNVMSGRVHTMITSAFSHMGAEHLIYNMIGLYFFGMNIGRTFGPGFLLEFYFAGAIGGSLFFLAHHAFLAESSKGRGSFSMDPSRTPGLGASGAVNAIMLLDIFLHPKSTLYLQFIVPVPAILLGIFLIGKDMLKIIEGDSNISGSAHLGGAAVAAIAWARIRWGHF